MWIPTKTKKYGVAIYNWNGEKRYGLPLEIGDTVHILEECTGWYRGFVTKNRSIKGIFPSNYIFLKPCKVENEGLYESVTSLEDPVVREVTLVLREWSVIWKSLFVERMKKNFDTLRNVMGELVEWRRQLLLGTLTQDQIRELKMKITGKIDWGNRNTVEPTCNEIDYPDLLFSEVFVNERSPCQDCNVKGHKNIFYVEDFVI